MRIKGKFMVRAGARVRKKTGLQSLESEGVRPCDFVRAFSSVVSLLEWRGTVRAVGLKISYPFVIAYPNSFECVSSTGIQIVS
jgi:hypothetical protein